MVRLYLIHYINHWYPLDNEVKGEFYSEKKVHKTEVKYRY